MLAKLNVSKLQMELNVAMINASCRKNGIAVLDVGISPPLLED